MKHILCLISLAFVGLLVFSGCQKTDSLVGYWSFSEGAMDLRADGTAVLIESSGTKTDAKWTRKNDHTLVIAINSNESTKLEFTFTQEGEILHMKSSDSGIAMDFKREPAPTATASPQPSAVSAPNVGQPAPANDPGMGKGD